MPCQTRSSLLNGKSLGKELRKLQANSMMQNDKCVNCKDARPGYICVSFRTFVCQECSDIHGEFGHKVASIDHSEWTEEEVRHITNQGGNAMAAEEYLAFWDQESFPQPTKVEAARLRDFVRKAYVIKCWRKQPDVKSGAVVGLAEAAAKPAVTDGVEVNSSAEDTLATGGVPSFATFDVPVCRSWQQGSECAEFDPEAKKDATPGVSWAVSRESTDGTRTPVTIDGTTDAQWQADFSSGSDMEGEDVFEQKAVVRYPAAVSQHIVEDLLDLDLAVQTTPSISKQDCCDLLCDSLLEANQQGAVEVTSEVGSLVTLTVPFSTPALAPVADYDPFAVFGDMIALAETATSGAKGDHVHVVVDKCKRGEALPCAVLTVASGVADTDAGRGGLVDRFAALGELQTSAAMHELQAPPQSSAFGDLLLDFKEKNSDWEGHNNSMAAKGLFANSLGSVAPEPAKDFGDLLSVFRQQHLLAGGAAMA